MQSFVSYIPIILPWLLFLIMFFMGITLTMGDFKRVAVYPKAVFVGLTNQILLVPLVGLAITKIVPMEAVFAMGVMVVAASPGGAVSNLFSHLSKGDTALSITMTAFSSIITVFSIPFIINWSLAHIIGGSGVDIQLPIIPTIINIFKLTVLPVGLGMLINYLLPTFSERMNKPIAWISTLIIVIALILMVMKLDEIGDVWEFVKASFLAVLLLNIFTLSIGYFSARMMKLERRQSISISIETGMQNNVLGMALATSPALLNEPMMAVPAGVYGLLMCSLGALLILWFRRMIEKKT